MAVATYAVLMEDVFTHEAIVVVMTAEGYEEIHAWSQDQGRGDWIPAWVVRKAPSTMSLREFEMHALRKNGRAHRKYVPSLEELRP